MEKQGVITELQRKNCLVDTETGIIVAVLKGALARKGRVYVGDRVQVLPDRTDSSRGTLHRVLPRHSVIHRPAIANINLMLAVATFREPPLDLLTLDKCLFNAEAHGLESVIIFNKTDLLSGQETEELEKTARIYISAGYSCVFCSAHTGMGIGEIADFCTDRTAALSGLSGVGKSRIMSRLFPEQDFVTGELSGRAERGTHTTTITSLLKLSENTYIADTPGFSLMDLPDVSETMASAFFKEMAPLVGQCKFNNCMHIKEPGCIVKDKVAQGAIAEHRYEHYLACIDELRHRQARRFQ